MSTCWQDETIATLDASAHPAMECCPAPSPRVEDTSLSPASGTIDISNTTWTHMIIQEDSAEDGLHVLRLWH